MVYGTGDRYAPDAGDDWDEPAARQPGRRRARSGRPGRGRGAAAGPGRASSRSARGRAYQRPPRGPGRWRSWRQFRSKSWLAQLGYTVAIIGAVVTVAAGIGGYYLYDNLTGFHVDHVGGLTGRTIYGAQNILVLGSQERQGQVGNFGYEADPWTTNSDNLLLVHLDPTHTHAIVLSIPRDTMVYEPGCKARISKIGDGIQGPYPSTIIDGALNIGGPTCAVETVTDLTGIKLDHFVEFDFNSFRYMVDAIGGVEVCVPKGGYHDPKSHLNLSAGKHLVSWNRALAYVRTRDTLQGPDAGGDLPRIELQQAFISSVLQKVNHNGLLTDPFALFHVAETAAKALTVDQNMGSVTSLLKLAKSLAGLRAKNVTMITMPNIFDPQNQNRLLPEQPEADVVFQMVKNGQAYHGHLPLTLARKIQVKVLNGTEVGGLAGRTAKALRKLGFDVIHVGDAPATTSTTVSYNGLASADAAYTLMSSLGSPGHGQQPLAQDLQAEPAPQEGRYAAITLTLGTDYASFPVNAPAIAHTVVTAKGKKKGSKPGTEQLAADTNPAGGAGGGVQSRNAAENTCAGLPLG
jgi:LCP family protein required for cell wall assembly